MSRKILAMFVFCLLLHSPAVNSSDEDSWRQEYAMQMKNGESLAEEALKEHNEMTEGKGFDDSSGILVAEGDSWFDYPFYDVLERLQWKYHYDIRSVAHRGDTLESMAYDTKQFGKFITELKKLKKPPKAILLSGGGNDIAHHELYVMLNHYNAKPNGLNLDLVKTLIRERARNTMLNFIGAISKECQEIFQNGELPVIVHGYADPVPDGRGYMGGYWVLPGPWLQPSFKDKGYLAKNDDLCEETLMMKNLITEYNAVLKDIASKIPHVHYVNVVPLFKDPDYKHDWNDELHPTKKLFEKVADEFQNVIKQLPN